MNINNNKQNKDRNILINTVQLNIRYTVNVRKQTNNDKLQGSVATYLRCGWVINNQIKKGLLLSLLVFGIKTESFVCGSAFCQWRWRWQRKWRLCYAFSSSRRKLKRNWTQKKRIKKLGGTFVLTKLSDGLQSLTFGLIFSSSGYK